MPDTDPLLHVDPWVALADGRSQLARALDDLTAAEAQLSAGLGEDARGSEWLVGDLLTHLEAWDRLVAGCLEGVVEGRQAGGALVADPEAEWAAWNAKQVAVGEAMPLEVRLERLAEARQALMEVASRVADDAFDTAMGTPWGVEESPRGMLVVQAMHDGMHAAVIAAVRANADAGA